MASSVRGPSIGARFEDVLDTVGRGFAPRSESEAAQEGPGSTLHASLDFLQALETVGDNQSLQSGCASGAVLRSYSEAELEAEARPETGPNPPEQEAHPEPEPTLPPEVAAFDEARVAEKAMPETCEPASLAAELGLRAGMTRRELQRLRRAFALENHPDRLDPARREFAARRMIANSLIDEALRRTNASR